MSASYVTIVVAQRTAESSEHSANAPVPVVPTRYFSTNDAESGYLVLFPEPLPNVPALGDYLAARLSAAGGSALLAEVSENDETLRMRLFEHGEPIDEYQTAPGYATGEELPPSGGDALRFCRLFGIDDETIIADIDLLLRPPHYDDLYGFAVASDRHEEIVELLGLPLSSVGVGYNDLLRGKLPEGITNIAEVQHAESQGGIHGSSLRQFALLDAPSAMTDAEIVSHFVSDMILLEETYDAERDLVPLGAVSTIRERFERLSAESGYSLTGYGSHWFTVDLPNGSLTVDLRNGETEEREAITLFVDTERSEALIPDLLHQLIAENGWTLYEYGTQTIVRPVP